MSLSKSPPYPYCDALGCFRHGMYDGKCPEHRIAELEAKHIALVDGVRELADKLTPKFETLDNGTRIRTGLILTPGGLANQLRALLGKESEG